MYVYVEQKFELKAKISTKNYFDLKRNSNYRENPSHVCYKAVVNHSFELSKIRLIDVRVIEVPL